jgi:tRNA G10  N-methylase Trm11
VNASTKTQPPRHPAKYSDALLVHLLNAAEGYDRILDPFAGTGKIGMLRAMGHTGPIYANDLEAEWLAPNIYGCDVVTFQDAEFLKYPAAYFDAIVTSPTYGNRMADHHKAKDGSKRVTYTHCLGHPLHAENTGAMQFGARYCAKHERIYAHLNQLVRPGGRWVVNVSNFIRSGKEVDVAGWTEKTLNALGLQTVEVITVKTPRMGFGANADKRVDHEHIIILQKPETE